MSNKLRRSCSRLRRELNPELVNENLPCGAIFPPSSSPFGVNITRLIKSPIALISRVGAVIDCFFGYTGRGVEGTGSDFAGIDGDFAGMDGDFAGMDGDFAGMDGDFAGVDGIFAGIEMDFAGMESRPAAARANLGEVKVSGRMKGSMQRDEERT